MAVKTSLAALLSSAALWAAPVHAQTPLVHLPLDGSAANSGSAGAAELLAPAGADQPQFIAGKSGQALSFGKGGGVAIPYEFNQEEHPQATVTMWIKIDQDSPYERELFSLGPGNGLLVTVSGQRKISVRSYRSAVHDKSFPLGEWVFVAGVVDNDAGSIRIQQNDDVFEAAGLDIRKSNSLAVTAPGSDERKHYIFVGADDFNSAAKEMKHIALDDVRLYDSALSASQIAAIRNGGVSRIADKKDRDSTVAIGETEKSLERNAPTKLPENIDKPGPVAQLPAPEKDAEPAPGGGLQGPISNTPDRNLTPPAGLPGEELEEDIASLPDKPAVEKVEELDCTDSTSSSVEVATTAGAFSPAFMKAIAKARSCGEELTVATSNEKGQWIVSTRDQVAYSKDLPDTMLASLLTLEHKYGGIDAADISESGAWFIAARKEFKENGLPADARRAAQIAVGSGGGVRYFDFSPSSAAKWVLIDKKNTVSGGDLPQGVLNALADLPSTKRVVTQLRFGPQDSWALLGSGSWVVTSNVDSGIRSQLTQYQESGQRLDHIVFSSARGGYLLYSKELAGTSATDNISKFEYGFGFAAKSGGATVWRSGPIWGRMKAYNLKAVQIAFIKDNKIEWARGYGVRNANEPESYVFADTTFEAASISKPIAAFGLMQLVEAGKLSLTAEGVYRDVRPLIPSGKRNDFDRNVRPEAGNLIQLLQHCASFCYSGYSQCMEPRDDGVGYKNPDGAAQYGVSADLPTSGEIIVGKNPADAYHALLRTMNPGVRHRYSTANWELVQALIDVHGGGFLTHMAPIIHGLDMTSTTYKSPYAKWNDGNHARGWNGVIVSPQHAYAEMAGASIVSTATDLAKFVIEVNRDAEEPNRRGLLSYDMTQTYLGRDSSIYGEQDYPTCAKPTTSAGTWALGIVRNARSGNSWGGKEFYTHGGLHNGYRARLVGLPTEKAGVIVLMTGTPANADKFFDELRKSLRGAYGL